MGTKPITYEYDETSLFIIHEDKYFQIWRTLFIFEIDDSLFDVLKGLTDIITSIIYVPVKYNDEYKDRLTQLFEYIIYTNQYYVNRVGILCYTKKIILDTKDVIAHTKRQITSTRTDYPTESLVMFNQAVTNFKASMADMDSLSNMTAFIRCSQYISPIEDSDLLEEKTTFSFEFRDNKMIGTLSAGITMGIYNISAIRSITRSELNDG